MKWETRQEFAALLTSVLESPGESVKRSGITTVTRHHVARRQFYVKTQTHGQRWWWPPKYFFKSPRGRHEWRLGRRLEELTIPVVPHLAYGERWTWRGLLETTLITEGLAGYLPLRGDGELSRPAFQRRLGELVRQMHDAGVIHEDLNRANLLYAAAVDAIRLVDLDKIRLRGELSVSQRLTNLALIGARLPVTDAFFDGYGLDIQLPRGQIIRQARIKREALMSQIARRWRAHTNDFDVRRVGQLRWWVRRGYEDKALTKILEAPDRFGGTGEDGLVIQRFGPGCSKARRCYREAYRLQLLGVDAPRPVAVGEQRWLGICRRSYFVAKS